MAARAIQAGCWCLSVGKAHRRALKISHRHLRVLTMALETPAHRQWRYLLHAVHCFDRPMATLAGNTGNHVLAMIEINKIRKVMDLHPADGTLQLDRFLELLDLDRLLLHDAVAVHADVRRGNACMTAGSRCGMAIEAWDFVVSRMDLVRKCDGLLRSITLMDSNARIHLSGVGPHPS